MRKPTHRSLGAVPLRLSIALRAMIARPLRLAGALAALAVASPAVAQVTFHVNRIIGQGSVVGTIQTSGKTGVLSLSDILTWNLTLTGRGGATTTLTSTGSASLAQLIGGDLTETGNKLFFNFSGTDGGYLGFQVNPGRGSGTKYWCNNTNFFGCRQGDSVVPQAYNDPSAQYQAESGIQVLGIGGPMQTQEQLIASLLGLIQSRTMQMISNNLFSSVLLGVNEQVSCGNCGGADVMFGSFNVGAHGRYSITPELTLLGGASIGQYHERGADVQLSATVAAALRYDPANMGSSRPFAEVGASASPDQTTVYSRPYSYESDSGDGATAVGAGKTHTSIWNVYGRIGYVSRLTPRDEVAVSATVSHTWQVVKSYAEAGDSANPFGASFAGGTDEMTVVGLGAQYTRLVTRRLEAGITAGVEHSIDPKSGLSAAVDGAGSPTVGPREQTWAVYGGRLGYRFSRRLVGDAFIDGVSGPAGIGNSVHGGVGLRVSF